ncbi:DUF1659 domain-containing protein [Clostridium oceanicum]|uniref:DUF1659 domain-containing protein n=1 Tax=Clostridium oceanicum TaxID=1543 RepID=A0ABN1JXW6_9CLOT
MAVAAHKNDSDIVLTLAAGLDKDGKEILRRKTISKINVNANDEDLFTIANEVEKVLMYEVREINRVDKSALVQES